MNPHPPTSTRTDTSFPYPTLFRSFIDANGRFSTANSGAMGTALQPRLSSYSERNLLVTAPDAPIGTDLGEGSFRLLPAYRSGYRLTVGSDYMVSRSEEHTSELP